MIQSGTVLEDTYQIISEIGHGGAGVIYLAYHIRLQKYVVLKRIKDNYTGVMNVRGEADILKRLHHTYLPNVYDFLQIGTAVYTVMDYIQGYDLQYYLDQNYTFSEQQLALWLSQLCEVLQYLHTRRPAILHSDIKPANIMITPEGNVCLIDFNISLDGEQTKSLQGISEWYAAPEQYRLAFEREASGIVLDCRMDIYSLGATFYRLMTGWLPNPQQGEPAPIMDLDIPYTDGLKAVVHRAMCMRREGRFESAAQMQRALLKCGRMDPQYKRLRMLQGLSAMMYVCILTIGFAMIFYGYNRSVREYWETQYDSFYESCEEQEDKKIVLQGVDLLNDFRLKGYLSRHADRKAEILHALGDAYYRMEEYDTAADYYAEATETDAQGDYTYDYVLALIRGGRTSEAETAIRRASREGLDSDRMELLKAELDLQTGEFAQAEETAETVMQSAGSIQMKQQAGELLAGLYGQQNRYEEQIAVLEEISGSNGDYRLLREIGKAAYHASIETEDEEEKQRFLKKAKESYEQLSARAYAGYEDSLNLAIIERMLGQYEESSRILEQLHQEYPQEYTPVMWLCYNRIDMMKKNGAWNNKSELYKLYEECRSLYDGGNETDSNMEQLIEFMNSLEAR